MRGGSGIDQIGDGDVEFVGRPERALDELAPRLPDGEGIDRVGGDRRRKRGGSTSEETADHKAASSGEYRHRPRDTGNQEDDRRDGT